MPLLRLTAAVIDLDQFCAGARLVKIEMVTAGSSQALSVSEEEKLGVLEELKVLDEQRTKTEADVKDKGRARIESPFSGFDQSQPDP